MAGQLSLFSAAYAEPAAADLAGLLCGPGQLVRRGPAARVSVVVGQAWRAEALLAELLGRGLAAEAVPTESLRSVRTGFDPALAGLAEAWSGSGAGKRPPPGLTLDGRSLRLWCIAAGRGSDTGYALGLGENDEACWPAVGAALARAGLPGVFVGPRGEGPAYRLVGQRRTSRLAELVGDPPAGSPPSVWPA